MSFTDVPTSVFRLSRANVKTGSQRRSSIKKGVLKKFGNFTGKHLPG